MKPETKSASSPAGSKHPRGQYPILDELIRLKLPVTRDAYLSLQYLGHPPETLSAEEELLLPPEFREDIEEPEEAEEPEEIEEPEEPEEPETPKSAG